MERSTYRKNIGEAIQFLEYVMENEVPLDCEDVTVSLKGSALSLYDVEIEWKVVAVGG